MSARFVPGLGFGLTGLMLALPLCAQTPPSAPQSPRPSQRFEYDANGNPTLTVQARASDGAGFAAGRRYDALGQLRLIIDARNGQTALQRNAQGALVNVTDPIGVSTTYNRDGMGQVLAEQSPDAGVSVSTYDAAGRLATSLDARGVTSTFHYDALGRPTRVQRSGGSQLAQESSWTYDETAPFHGTAIGRLTTSRYPSGSTAYGYDALGRVVAERRTLVGSTGAPITHQTGYAWDAAGRMQTLSYPSGRSVSYTIAGGRVIAVSTNSPARPSVLLADQLTWEPFGPVRAWRWAYAGQPAHEIVRDLDGRVVRHTLGPWVRDIRHDAWDRVESMRHYLTATGAADPSRDQSFQHDELGRLTQWNVGDQSAAVGYDANGNRTWYSNNGLTTWLGREAGTNRLALLANPMRTAQYDAAGNLAQTSDGMSLRHDATGQLGSVQWAQGLASFWYDDQRRRVRARVELSGAPQQVPQIPGPPGDTQPVEPPPQPSPEGAGVGLVTQQGAAAASAEPSAGDGGGSAVDVVFAYDLLGRLIGEYDAADGVALREYVWLDERLMAINVYTRSAPGSSALHESTFYVHADHLGAPRVVVDGQGRLRWTWLADPFGLQAPDENPAGLGPFRLGLGLPGQYRDLGMSFIYNWHRYYDAGNGRYIQSDPIGLHGGINTYAYVGGNPVSLVDEDGLRPRSQRPTVRPNPAVDAAGYHDIRGEIICLEWNCPNSPDACSRDDTRNPTDFIPAAFNPAASPKGCKCTRARYVTDWSPPNQANAERDVADAFNRYRDYQDFRGEFWRRAGDVRQPLPIWHQIGVGIRPR